jgi:SprT-like protein
MNNNWNETKLTVYAYNWLITEYGIELNIPIYISKRLKATFGYFKHQNKIPLEIQLSYDLINYQDEDTIIDVFKHELIHYVCFITGKQYKDGSRDFENELRRQGVSSTKTYKYKGKGHEYRCTCCNKIVKTKQKGYDRKYICGLGKGRFIYVGETIIA